VIDGGRIVEDGPIRDLRLAGGLFEPMWQLQAEGIAGAAVIEAASVVRVLSRLTETIGPSEARSAKHRCPPHDRSWRAGLRSPDIGASPDQRNDAPVSGSLVRTNS
jgi:hypothetical protein